MIILTAQTEVNNLLIKMVVFLTYQMKMVLEIPLKYLKSFRGHKLIISLMMNLKKLMSKIYSKELLTSTNNSIHLTWDREAIKSLYQAVVEVEAHLQIICHKPKISEAIHNLTNLTSFQEKEVQMG